MKRCPRLVRVDRRRRCWSTCQRCRLRTCCPPLLSWRSCSPSCWRTTQINVRGATGGGMTGTLAPALREGESALLPVKHRLLLAQWTMRCPAVLH